MLSNEGNFGTRSHGRLQTKSIEHKINNLFYALIVFHYKFTKKWVVWIETHVLYNRLPVNHNHDYTTNSVHRNDCTTFIYLA